MSARPTPEQIAEKRAVLAELGTLSGKRITINESELDAIRVLLAATEPREEIPNERRNHFRMTPHRRPSGPVFCVDQRGNGEFDVYFDDRSDVKVVWSDFQLYQFGQWARQAWSKK